jgi:heat shock protein HtpX
VVPLGNMATEACGDGRNVFRTVPGASHIFTLALGPTDGHVESPRLSLSGGTLIVEMQLPSGQPGLALFCCIHTKAHAVADWQRWLNRAHNHRRSGRLIAGMILLLATCGWIVGGEDGAKRAVSVGAPLPHDLAIAPEIMLQQLGARLLHPSEAPVLFDVLRDICRRAGLLRCPELYYLPAAGAMNAYALGDPRRSAITLTDGLLRGMTLNEIAGILAHEVAHIRNSDASAMTWASMLNRAIALTSLASLATLQRQNGAPEMPLAALLSCASTIGQLLYLALSRIREFDADATALELIDDPQALVSALHKLERHHNAAQDLPAASLQDGHEFLRTHPATHERVGHLRRLAFSI